ncbi:hypothetical protein IMG5_156380 [Ichthyophthirius multifiliis]|uniref:Intimal thickness related receptor IRP domain-containing protein n=1 Tax=Ichthyophthirius multifiliis TaxID=5932 RepID=G0QZF8_ICHMU|nr:hypothetical protein IMG5_156380 [Ichthyophthirius multifiliis]EGR29396.1 hypothetical protein IMG5_156380 [Ichthyophthirius multifiliis]|eukprot:XP_004030632.1 hypothetical protein IMG5_156380 [Ichthyophthirius multifiliis]
MSIGKGTYQIRAKFENPVTGTPDLKENLQINFAIYQDDVWSKIYDEKDCSLIKQSARERRLLHIPINGQFSPYIKGDLQQRKREHVWYFSLNDCDENLSTINNNKIVLELTILNSDESHFSFEDGNYTIFYLLISVFSGFLFFYNIKHLKILAKQNEETNAALLMLIIAIGAWKLNFSI